MKIQILSDAVLVRDFPARGDRPALTFRQQKAAIIRDGEFPLPFKVSLKPDQRPYSPGFYEFTTESFLSDEYERLKFSRDIGLSPLPASAKA